MEIQIFKNDDDYDLAVKSGASISYYTATISGYEYVMHGPLPFKFLTVFGERFTISPLDISNVIRTRDCVTVILNLDSMCNATWADILNAL